MVLITVIRVLQPSSSPACVLHVCSDFYFHEKCARILVVYLYIHPLINTHTHTHTHRRQ